MNPVQVGGKWEGRSGQTWLPCAVSPSKGADKREEENGAADFLLHAQICHPFWIHRKEAGRDRDMSLITEHAPKVRLPKCPSRQLERRPAGSRGADCARLSASCGSDGHAAVHFG